jgi:transposase
MLVKTILYRVQKLPGFVCGRVGLVETANGSAELHVGIRARKRSKPICSGCGEKRPCYDHLPQRHYLFVPLWAIAVFFVYAPRRANCKRCGVTVEMLPWADGKSHLCNSYAWFLASWAKVLSWTEVRRRFRTSWQTVFRSVQMAVEWGRAHMNLDGIESIGVDELAWKKGHKYLTFVYQIDHDCKRLLWIGKDRTAATFNGFFDWLGDDRAANLRFVASDMWKAFLRVVRRRASHVRHVLDRFHVAQALSKAVDTVRRQEVRELRKKGLAPVLAKTRWILLKRSWRLLPSQASRLADLLRHNLRTVRAYLLSESLQYFWGYTSPYWAGRYLDCWCATAMRSRIEPVKKFVRTLRSHRELLLNWFRARHAFSHGATEGFNNKARVTTKRAYGFRSYEHARIALFHTLGNLPEPDFFAHKFW